MLMYVTVAGSLRVSAAQPQSPMGNWLMPESNLSITLFFKIQVILGFPGGSDGKETACNAGDPGSIAGLEKSPGVGNRNPFQNCCLENSMDKGAWQATVHGVAKSWTPLSTHSTTQRYHK